MIITRYLTREVVSTLTAVTVVLLLAFLSQQIVRYLNYVAVGKIPTSVLLQLISFEIPYLLAFLLPLGLYLGILLVFGRLYVDNEMAILQMYGFGRRRILRFTAAISAVIGFIVLFLMLWVNPFLSGERQQVMENEESTVKLVETLIPGRFQVSPDGRNVMYVEKLSRDHQRAENVFLAQAKKPAAAATNQTEEWVLVLAKEGYQTKGEDAESQFFVTQDGYRYEGVPGQNDYKIIQFRKYSVRIPPNDFRTPHKETEALSFSQLLSEYTIPKQAAELQWRFSAAISAVLLALLAVPLSTVRPRQGRYLMLLPAIILYILYIQLLFIARRWVEEGVVPISIGMWWVHLIFIGLFLGMLFVNARSGK